MSGIVNSKAGMVDYLQDKIETEFFNSFEQIVIFIKFSYFFLLLGYRNEFLTCNILDHYDHQLEFRYDVVNIDLNLKKIYSNLRFF